MDKTRRPVTAAAPGAGAHPPPKGSRKRKRARDTATPLGSQKRLLCDLYCRTRKQHLLHLLVHPKSQKDYLFHSTLCSDYLVWHQEEMGERGSPRDQLQTVFFQRSYSDAKSDTWRDVQLKFRRWWQHDGPLPMLLLAALRQVHTFLANPSPASTVDAEQKPLPFTDACRAAARQLLGDLGAKGQFLAHMAPVDEASDHCGPRVSWQRWCQRLFTLHQFGQQLDSVFTERLVREVIESQSLETALEADWDQELAGGPPHPFQCPTSGHAKRRPMPNLQDHPRLVEQKTNLLHLYLQTELLLMDHVLSSRGAMGFYLQRSEWAMNDIVHHHGDTESPTARMALRQEPYPLGAPETTQQTERLMSGLVTLSTWWLSDELLSASSSEHTEDLICSLVEQNDPVAATRTGLSALLLVHGTTKPEVSQRLWHAWWTCVFSSDHQPVDAPISFYHRLVDRVIQTGSLQAALAVKESS